MSTSRVALWDNTRFVAIVLVVLGHSLTKTVGSSDIAAASYFWIYAFHIPLFVALAGFFSKADPPDRTKLGRLVTDLVVPYLIFEVIWSAVAMIRLGHWSFDPLRPSWTLWFLLSLVAWRILLPLIALTRAPLALSLVVGLGSGYFAVDQTLSLSRTLALLPFFVLGWRASATSAPGVWSDLGGARLVIARVAALTALMATAVVAYLVAPMLVASDLRWMLTYDRPYAEAGLGEWWSAAARMGIYLLATLIMLAVVLVVPRREMWMSSFGQTTMYVYLLHSFPIAALRALGVLSGETTLWMLVLLIPGSVLLSLALGSAPVVRVTKILIQPDWARKLLK